MLKSIVNYVNHNYPLCEITDTSFLSFDEKANECFIKSCLVYKNLHEIYLRRNISLLEAMFEMDVADFSFTTASSVLKNHLIFHHAFKYFWREHKKRKTRYLCCRYNIQITNSGFYNWSCILVFS